MGPRDYLILGAGFAHIRKGFDLFLQLARKVLAQRADVHFVWVGDIQSVLKTYLAPEMAQAAATGRFHHIPFTERVAPYFSAADVLALTSREDPFPTVVMEALACGVPCVAFDETGRHSGAVAARECRAASPGWAISMSSRHNWSACWRMRNCAVNARGWRGWRYKNSIFPAMWNTCCISPSRICARSALPCSAIIMPVICRGGWQSVFAQTYPVREILFLDDASSDGSIEIAQAQAQAAKRELRVLENARNSGSVFAQWRRAAQAAQGEFLWLCEADDSADAGFLARLMAAMAGVAQPLLAFTDSRAVDAAGQPVMPSYQSYYFSAGVRELAASGVWEADAFARMALWERNLIPNVSAVLWRREALLRALDAVPELESWQVAGDWRLYLALLAGEAGSVVYLAEPLNVHRRHASGVTQRLEAAAHVREIARMQDIAARTLGLDGAARAAQADYARRITQQLNVTKHVPKRAPAKIVHKTLNNPV